MTRAASILAFFLAGLLAAAPWLAVESTLSLPLTLCATVLLLIAGFGALGHRGFFHGALLLLALAVLMRFLPSLYQNSRFWPDLVVIFLAMLVFGLGLIGFILDRYTGRSPAVERVAP